MTNIESKLKNEDQLLNFQQPTTNNQQPTTNNQFPLLSKPRKDEPLKTPHYRGGNEALFKFIKSNLNYPEEALANKIEGDVEASYDVDGLGRTRNIKIVTSLGYGCDEEVKRLIGLLKYESLQQRPKCDTSPQTQS